MIIKKNIQKIALFLGFLFLLGCDSENAGDCFQAAGDIVQESYDDLAFDEIKKIIIWNRVKLIISQGDTPSVVVETGENLLNEIQVRVEDSILKVSNRNSCNYVREYGITKVFVTVPELEEIQNSSGLAVESIGPIRFDKLDLISQDPELDDRFHKDGDFIMNEMFSNNLSLTSNGLTNFFLKGSVLNLSINAIDSDVRVEAAELEAQNVLIFHRSSNKIIVNPQNSIRGRIVSLGDVISVNRPPIVEVEETFRGRLIFE